MPGQTRPFRGSSVDIGYFVATISQNQDQVNGPIPNLYGQDSFPSKSSLFNLPPTVTRRPLANISQDAGQVTSPNFGLGVPSAGQLLPGQQVFDLPTATTCFAVTLGRQLAQNTNDVGQIDSQLPGPLYGQDAITVGQQFTSLPPRAPARANSDVYNVQWNNLRYYGQDDGPVGSWLFNLPPITTRRPLANISQDFGQLSGPQYGLGIPPIILPVPPPSKQYFDLTVGSAQASRSAQAQEARLASDIGQIDSQLPGPLYGQDRMFGPPGMGARPNDWPVPPGHRWRFTALIANNFDQANAGLGLLTFSAPVGEAIFDLPTPAAQRARDYSITARFTLELIGQDNLPPGRQATDLAPRAHRRLPDYTWFDTLLPNLLGQDAMLVGRQYDALPTPAALRARDYSITHRNVLYFGQDALAIGEQYFDLPTPATPRARDYTWIETLIPNLVGRDALVPGKQATDLPRGPLRAADYTWIDTLLPNLLGQDQFFTSAGRGAPGWSELPPVGPRRAVDYSWLGHFPTPASLESGSSRDTVARFALVASGYRDTAARFALQSTTQYRDTVSRFVLSAQAYRDTNARFKLQSATTYRDTVSRFVLSATAYRDTEARFALQAQAYRDTNARFALLAQAYRDTVARFSLTAAQVRDTGARFALTDPPFPRQFFDLPPRAPARARDYSWLGHFPTPESLVAHATRDTNARFKLLASGYRDTVARFALQSTAIYRDTNARFALSSVTTYRDTVSRFALQAQQYRDTSARFALLASQTRDTAARFALTDPPFSRQFFDLPPRAPARARDYSWLGHFPNPDSLVAHATRDTTARFKLLASGYRDTSARFLLQSATRYRDTIARFKLQSATAYRDTAARFLLQGQAYRDTSARFSLLASQTRDTGARFALTDPPFPRQFFDLPPRAPARARDYSWLGHFPTPESLVAHAIRDTAARFKLVASGYRDTVSRFVLQSATQYRDTSARFVLAAQAYRDAEARFALRSQVTNRDTSARFKLQSGTNRDTVSRFVLRAQGYRDTTTLFSLASTTTYVDTAARALVGQPTNRDTVSRFVMRASATLDTAARFALAVAGLERDQNARLALAGAAYADTVALFSLRSSLVAVDTGGRFALKLPAPIHDAPLIARGPSDARTASNYEIRLATPPTTDNHTSTPKH